MNIQIVLNTPKTLLLNEAAQKILAEIFLPKQIPKLKISNPKTSFDHPCHLKSGVPPQGLQQPCQSNTQSTRCETMIFFSFNKSKSMQW